MAPIVSSGLACSASLPPAGGATPSIAMEPGHTEAIKQAAAAGLGVSILSRLTVERELALGLLGTSPLAGPEIGRDQLLVRQRQARLAGAAHAFVVLLRADA